MIVPPEHGAPTVLVLEDEAPVRESLRRYLELIGYRVCLCENVDQAFDTLSHSSVDAAILDVRLPHDRSGLEVLEFARLDEGSRDLPVLVLTAFRLSPDEEDIIRRHGAYVFYKPQEYSELAKCLERAVHRGVRTKRR